MKFGLTWKQKLGLKECPYLIRWVFNTRFGSIRLHKWISSDDDRAYHDHPWWFVTLVLSGGYTDVSDAGRDKLGPGSLRFRRARHRHTVEVSEGGAWTILITGPETRRWGFWTLRRDGTFRFKRALKYFAEEGHHPCTSGQTPVRFHPDGSTIE